MPAGISGLVGRAQKTVGQFSLAQRTLAILGVAVLGLGLFAVSAWLSKPSMSPLFANLAASDASAIVDQLDSEGVTYELSDGGSTILVPESEVYAMRIKVASAGLPAASDGGGYSLLDDMGMTSSEFQQQVTYQRAIEGELAKTIGAISGVQTASVHLALPQESVFVSETPAPTASVFVETAPGSTLDADKVQAIVHLVSAGIEGMAPSDVAVIDADGQVLSAVGGEGATGLEGNQSSDYEARVATNVQQMLDKVVGPGNAVVSVTADLNFDETARTTDTYSADAALPPISSATTLETYTGTGAATGGVLGSGTAATTATGSTGGDYRKETATVNNPLNHVVEQTTTAPGTVRRQSVSVVLSDAAGAGVDLAALQTAVEAAAGIDATRGDVVSVTRMAFDTSTAEAATAALAEADKVAAAAQTTELIKMGAIGVGILLAVILMIVTAARRSRAAKRSAIDLGALDVLEARNVEAIETADAMRALPAAPVPQDDPLAAKREDVLALAAEQPAEVAEVLRTWLAAGRR